MSRLPILYSRSAVEADWRCPRRRYWNYEHLGRGITPQSTQLELYMGASLHDGLAAIVEGNPIDLVAKTAFDQVFSALKHPDETFAREQGTLIEGLLRAFNKYLWPMLVVEFPEVVAVEKEIFYNHDSGGRSSSDGAFRFMAKPDLLVRDSQGDLHYIEWKSTSTNKDQWINSWDTAVQLHSTCHAVEQTLGEPISAVHVIGLYKGYVSYGKQNSPLCYAYHRPGEPPFTKSIWSYQYKPGLKKYPIWERLGGVSTWVDSMPEDKLAELFPRTPPIFINRHLVDAFFAQRAQREAHIAEVGNPDPTDLDDAFPQKFSECAPGWGKPCPYRILCHSEGVNPEKAGFVVRESHHEAERKRHEEEATEGITPGEANEDPSEAAQVPTSEAKAKPIG